MKSYDKNWRACMQILMTVNEAKEVRKDRLAIQKSRKTFFISFQ